MGFLHVSACDNGETRLDGWVQESSVCLRSHTRSHQDWKKSVLMKQLLDRRTRLVSRMVCLKNSPNWVYCFLVLAMCRYLARWTVMCMHWQCSKARRVNLGMSFVVIDNMCREYENTGYVKFTDNGCTSPLLVADINKTWEWSGRYFWHWSYQCFCVFEQCLTLWQS